MSEVIDVLKSVIHGITASSQIVVSTVGWSGVISSLCGAISFIMYFIMKHIVTIWIIFLGIGFLIFLGLATWITFGWAVHVNPSLTMVIWIGLVLVGFYWLYRTLSWGDFVFAAGLGALGFILAYTTLTALGVD